MERFRALLNVTALVSDGAMGFIPEAISLAEKDRPILAAAIAGSVEYLVTGDRKHFGDFYGTAICGVRIMAPADFLERNQYRLKDKELT